MPPTKRMKSLVEKEYDLMEYDVLEGTFDDYKEMVFQFGYATIFFTAFPCSPDGLPGKLHANSIRSLQNMPA